jgi:hypothetical protein
MALLVAAAVALLATFVTLALVSVNAAVDRPSRSDLEREVRRLHGELRGRDDHVKRWRTLHAYAQRDLRAATRAYEDLRSQNERP